MELSDVIGLAGVPLIAALVQVSKAWLRQERYYPVMSLVLGLALNIGVAISSGSDVPTAVLLGIIAGLAASGLYSQGRALTAR